MQQTATRMTREPRPLLALFVAASAHAAFFAAGVWLHEDVSEGGAGKPPHSVRVHFVGSSPSQESGSAPSGGGDVADRLERLQRGLATTGSGPAGPQPPPVGASATADGGIDGLLEGAAGAATNAAGPAGAFDPYSRASFDRRELASARSGEDQLRSQAARCLGDRGDMATVRLRVRLRPDGGLAAAPQAVGPGSRAKLAHLRSSQAQAIQAVIQCAPYAVASGGARPRSYDIELGSVDY